MSSLTHWRRVMQHRYGILITLKKLCDTLTPSTMETLILTLVMPHVIYCLPAWAPPTQHLKQRINKILNFAIRIFTRKRWSDHVSAARKQLGWLSFYESIEYRDCVLLHRLVLRSDTPHNLRSLVRTRGNISERTTRATRANGDRTKSQMILSQKTKSQKHYSLSCPTRQPISVRLIVMDS